MSQLKNTERNRERRKNKDSVKEDLLRNFAAFEDQENLPKLSGNIWVKFFKLAKPSKKLFTILMIFMTLLAVFDNLSPLMVRFSVDYFIANGITEGLVVYGLAFALLVLLQATADRVFMRVAGQIETDIAYSLREKGFQKLQSLDFAYYDRTAVGWILARLINDVTNVTEVIAWSLTDLVWGASTVLLILVAMFWLNWKLTLLVLLALPPTVFIVKYFQGRILKHMREVKQANSAITAAYNEGIMGARTGKTLSLAEPMQEEFNLLTTHYKDRYMASNRLAFRFNPLIQVIGIVSAAVVLVVGGAEAAKNALTLGTLYTFFIYCTKLWEPIANAADIISEFQSAQAAVERVLQLFAETPDIQDRPDVLRRYGLKDGEGEEPWPDFKGNIEFKNVSFAYVEDEPVLKNFNLKVNAGEKIALVGETGAGKSTLVNLACRFYEPDEGEILFDGVDYREYPLPWLYNQLGYVLQTPQLFSGTIAENIRYGRLQATDEEVRRAARLVNAEEFILKRHDGYQTQVGEAGDRLSTGEKQLISFARAVIADPAFFVLDEATSSIDTETEKRIQEAIENILAGRTAFIVAHRLSTIRNVDRIIVIEDGEIVESGTHDQLMQKGGRYYTYYSGQFKIGA